MARLGTLVTMVAHACLFYLVLGLIGCSDNASRATPKEDPLVKAGGYDSGIVPGARPGVETTYSEKNFRETVSPLPGVFAAPEDVMQFAESLIGTPYQYASSDPAVGFDCSGFITYVFNHFNITVPRSSIGFTDLGTAIREEDASRGDIILFTGTNPEETLVGHMGLITSNDDKGIHFIHSTSGKANAVTITPLNDYYRTRLVGFRRILQGEGALP